MLFESLAEAAAWAEGNGGEQGLRVAIQSGIFGNNQRGIAFAEEWLPQQDAARGKATLRDEQLLRAREVRAAEASAIVARDSADSAKAAAEAARVSARWSIWMTVIALVAVIVALAK